MIVQMAFTNNAEWEPDLGVVVMDMMLAHELLADKQYKLGRTMLAEAIRECNEPLSMNGLQHVLNDMLAELLDANAPIFDIFTRGAK